MNKPTLKIMVGLSASGKSTIARNISSENNCLIVSSDDIRDEICECGVIDQTKNEEVFKIFNKRIKDELLSGRDVIADATNINLKSRRSILNNVKNIDCQKIAYIVSKSVEKCIDDNIYKDYPVPHHVIQKQMMNFQIPFLEEGFDKIVVHKFDKEYDLELSDIFEKMKGFNQKNPYHNETLDQHCLITTDHFSNCNTYDNCYDLYNASCLHDIGKLFTQKFDDNGTAHYFQHENVGSYYILSNYNNLDIEEESIVNICFLINYHMLPMNWNTQKVKDKWIKIFGEYKFNMLTFFNECDKIRL